MTICSAAKAPYLARFKVAKCGTACVEEMNVSEDSGEKGEERRERKGGREDRGRKGKGGREKETNEEGGREEE